jgi:hypothetical protein
MDRKRKMTYTLTNIDNPKKRKKATRTYTCTHIENLIYLVRVLSDNHALNLFENFRILWDR